MLLAVLTLTRTISDFSVASQVLTMRKLESWVSNEDRMIVAGVVLTQCQRVTDRQTDGFTIANTALCIASYADAL